MKSITITSGMGTLSIVQLWFSMTGLSWADGAWDWWPDPWPRPDRISLTCSCKSAYNSHKTLYCFSIADVWWLFSFSLKNCEGKTPNPLPLTRPVLSGRPSVRPSKSSWPWDGISPDAPCFSSICRKEMIIVGYVTSNIRNWEYNKENDLLLDHEPLWRNHGV